MITSSLGHVGFDTSLFSGISARREGLSTDIEAGRGGRGGAGAHPVDAERSRAGRCSPALCTAEQPYPAPQDLGVLQLVIAPRTARADHPGKKAGRSKS